MCRLSIALLFILAIGAGADDLANPKIQNFFVGMSEADARRLLKDVGVDISRGFEGSLVDDAANAIERKNWPAFQWRFGSTCIQPLFEDQRLSKIILFPTVFLNKSEFHEKTTQAYSLVFIDGALKLLDGQPVQTQRAKPGGAGQPATAPESKSEGGGKPQPEAEGRSR